MLIEGVFGRENLLEFGERCSADEREDDERTENRGFCGFAWAYAMRRGGGEETLMADSSLFSSADLTLWLVPTPESAGEMDPFSLSSPPTSPAYTPDTMAAHPPRNLQDHLYTSFLEGSTADVALHVSGSWEAVYKLHRVVLIQAVSILHSPPSLHTESVYSAATGILPTPLYSRFLRITFPPEALTVRWS